MTNHEKYFSQNSLPEGERYEQVKLVHGDDFDPEKHVDELQAVRSSVEGDNRATQPLAWHNGSTIFLKSDISLEYFNVLTREQHGQRKPSFAGFQDKFVAKLRKNEKGELIASTVDQNTEVGNLLVKPGNPKLPYIAENECLCMRLGKAVNISAPDAFLIKGISNPRVSHFCVDRFDLDYSIAHPITGNCPVKRVMYEFCPLMGRYSNDKYSATTEELFTFASSILSSEDLNTFAQTYLLGFLVGNSDMHLKNFAVFPDKNDSKYQLAFLYDMLCTTIYGFNTKLALEMNIRHNTGEKEFSFGPPTKTFLKFIRNYLDKDDITTMIGNIQERLPRLIEDVFQTRDKPAEKFSDSELSNAEFINSRKYITKVDFKNKLFRVIMDNVEIAEKIIKTAI